MRDFNDTRTELIKHLRLCGEAPDGRIYWYEGTIPLLFEIVGCIPSNQKEKEETPAKNCRTCKYTLGREWPCIDCSMQNGYDRWELKTER